VTPVRRLAAAAPLVALVALAVVVPTAPPAGALSCVDHRTVVAEASSLFTGRVVDTEDGALVVAVEEVRRGEAPARASGDTVRLQLEAVEYGTWPHEDGELADGYRSGRTWQFAPYEDDGTWVVNPCTAWATGADTGDGAWERTGRSPDDRPIGGPVAWAGAAGGVAVAGGVAAWLVRRRRTPRT
jgi:hypothetical protein